jgi:hypothetical protein
MYQTIKGIYRKGQIVPMEKIELEKDEVNLIITFLEDDGSEFESQTSAHEILYTMGDRAAEGKLKNGAEKHDQYLYSPGSSL